MEEPLIDKEFRLEKFPGKGGWTYARIPEILPDKKAHFGWVKVRGTIDGYAIDNYNLMPMGSGQLFLPVKAAIRKSIGKNEGDLVHVVLFAQNSVNKVREELLLCLEDEPVKLKVFLNLPEDKQKTLVDWIAAAKNEEMKVERIAQAIDKIAFEMAKV